jgi:hypothetical protein
MGTPEERSTLKNIREKISKDPSSLCQTFEKSHMLLRHTDMLVKDEISSSDNPEIRYYPRGKKTLNTHDGQMKLLLADEMSIVEGLRHIITTNNISLQDVKDKTKMVAVVVAGASPGPHFVNLSSTFAFIDFHLYDPCEQSPWDKVLVAHATPSSSPNIFLFKAKFTNEKALEWRKTHTKYEYVIFLSDLRTGDGHNKEKVSGDMALQRSLTCEMQADYSVLKFHPPYCGDNENPKYEYLDGKIYFEAYPPRNSTETRLHVTDTKSKKTYNSKKYQDQMFWHNQITRNKNLISFEAMKEDMKHMFENSLSYDDAHSRFVKLSIKNFLNVDITENNVGHFTFNHDSIRTAKFHIHALLEQLHVLNCK